MKPRSVEFLFGSRYTLPLWLLAGIWLYLKISPLWEIFTPVQQVALAFASIGYGFMMLISFIKVFPYERALLRQGDAGRSPEQIAQRRRRRKPFLLFLASGGGIAGLWWINEHPNLLVEHRDLSLYALLICFAFAALPLLLGLTALVSRLPSMFRRIFASVPKKPEKPFIVQWCQPVPKQAASVAQIREALPDYCKLLFSPAQNGEQKPATASVRNPLNAVAGVAATHS